MPGATDNRRLPFICLSVALGIVLFTTVFGGDHAWVGGNKGTMLKKAVADLAITKTDNTGLPPSPQIEYTLTVSNDGPDVAMGVTVSDDLPGVLTLVSVTSTQGSCSGQVGAPGALVQCDLGDLGDLDASVTSTVEIVVRATSQGSVSNSATVAGSSLDPDASNNAATTSTTVEVIAAGIPVSPGYNLIGIPVSFTTTTRTRDLADAVLPGGVDIEDGPVTAVLTWNGSGYTPWLSSNPAANNFELEAGNAYFVRLQSSVPGDKLWLGGLPLDAPVTLALSAGYNLVGVPYPASGSYDTLSFAEAIDQHDGGSDLAQGPVLSILRWDGSYTAWLRDNPAANVFALDSDRGCFVRVSRMINSFTP